MNTKVMNIHLKYVCLIEIFLFQTQSLSIKLLIVFHKNFKRFYTE